MAARWYGEDIAFRTAVEAGARRRYGRHLCVRQSADQMVEGRHGLIVIPGELIYAVDGIPVRGRAVNVPIEVRFRPVLPPPYGRLIRAEDYPSVYAEREMSSPHRLHDRALCLYYPGDPPELRWESRMGLLSLLEASAEHLYFESYWRRNRIWLGDEAPLLRGSAVPFLHTGRREQVRSDLPRCPSGGGCCHDRRVEGEADET